MASSSNNKCIETNSIPPVTEAVLQYRILEDGALAQHLQEREIEYHLGLNIQQRRTVIEDIKTAKILQDEEDKKAMILTLDEQEKLKYKDEKLAEAVQDQLIQMYTEEETEKMMIEARDKELVHQMIEQELRLEKRQQHNDQRLAKKLSEMQMKEMRNNEINDEELAWQMQEAERKKFKHKMQSREHMNAVIQMQDEELARFICTKEMEKTATNQNDLKNGIKTSFKKQHHKDHSYPDVHHHALDQTYQSHHKVQQNKSVQNDKENLSLFSEGHTSNIGNQKYKAKKKNVCCQNKIMDGISHKSDSSNQSEPTSPNSSRHVHPSKISVLEVGRRHATKEFKPSCKTAENPWLRFPQSSQHHQQYPTVLHEDFINEETSSALDQDYNFRDLNHSGCKNKNRNKKDCKQQ